MVNTVLVYLENFCRWMIRYDDEPFVNLKHNWTRLNWFYSYKDYQLCAPVVLSFTKNQKEKKKDCTKKEIIIMRNSNLDIKTAVRKVIDELPFLKPKTRAFVLSSLIELFHIEDKEEKMTYANIILDDVKSLNQTTAPKKNIGIWSGETDCREFTKYEISLIDRLKEDFYIDTNFSLA